ncbi:MAG: hypothetical protein KJO98_12785 [Rhodothermia bacterium]|nr:hypothetical protein [Rhodothermia bacterium]
MKDVLRRATYIIPAFLLVGLVQAQSLDRGSHKVTISRSPDTRLVLPSRSRSASLAGIDPRDAIQVKSNIPRLKLVLSVVEPREASSADYLTAPPEQFRTLFSSESVIERGPVERIPVARLVSEIPDEIAYEEKRGRTIVVTVTE